MNKEAELPKCIDFSQLPEARRAFKKGKDAHSYTQAWAHRHAQVYRDPIQMEGERFKSERIIPVPVSVKTQFGLSRFPTSHQLSDKRAHSKPAGFYSLLLASGVTHALSALHNDQQRSH